MQCANIKLFFELMILKSGHIFKCYVILNSSYPVDWWRKPTLSLQVRKMILEITITTKTALWWQNVLKLLNHFL